MNDKGDDKGGSILGWLFVLFVVLKLCGVIDWSWWWVTAPLWGGLAVALAMMAATLVIGGLIMLVLLLVDL